MNTVKVKELDVFEVALMLFLQNLNDPFMDQIVTCDEKWILYNNCKQSDQWFDHDEASKHLTKLKIQEQKIMVAVWWFAIVHFRFLESSQSITE